MLRLPLMHLLHWALALNMLFQPVLAALPRDILDTVWSAAEVLTAHSTMLRPPMQSGSSPLYAIVPKTSSVSGWAPIFDPNPTNAPYDFPGVDAAAREIARKANTFYVNDKTDTGDPNLSDNKCDINTSTTDVLECTLRAAVQQANATSGKQVIILPGWTFELTGASGEDAAASGDLDITDTVVIQGRFPDRTVIKPASGSPDRIFHIKGNTSSAIEVHLINLTVSNGSVSSSGGGIRVEQTSTCSSCSTITVNVTLDRVRVVSNTASGANGGGLHAAYTASGTSHQVAVTIKNSLFQSNTAANGGAISSSEEAKVTIENTTIDNNTATSRGGGLWAEKVNADGVTSAITLRHVTLVYNTASTSGGGIRTQGANFPAASLSLTNSIIANNLVGTPTVNCDLAATPPTLSGYNMSDETSCSLGTTAEEPGLVVGTGNTPAQNGGGTETYAPTVGSNVLNKNTTNCQAKDQRGAVRQPAGTSDSCDIGAHEVAPIPDRAVSGSGPLCTGFGCGGENYALGTIGMPAGSTVNSRTGNVMEYVTDITIPSPAGPISFSRSYSSYNAQGGVSSSGLPQGWNHNYHVRLIDMTGGPVGKLVFMPDGSRIGFYGSSPYTAEPGVNGSLVRTGTSPNYIYTYTNTQGVSYEFNNSGVLQKIDSGMGQVLVMCYTTGGLLEKIKPNVPPPTDPCTVAGGLTLNYTGSNLTSVTDGVRTITYGRNGNGQLNDVTDVNGKHWGYDYYGSPNTNLLWKRFAPDSTGSATIKTAEFNYATQSTGRVDTQLNALNNEVVNLGTYDTSTRSAAFTDGTGISFTHQYNTEEALAKVIFPAGSFSYLFDPNYRLSQLLSGNKNITDIGWSADSADMTAINNAIQEGASYEYNASHRVKRISYPDGTITLFIYNDVPAGIDDPTLTGTQNLYNSAWDNDVLLMRVDNFTQAYSSESATPNGENVKTTYEYTDGAGQPENLVAKVLPPTDVDICYSYDANGQVTQVSEDCGGSSPILTKYEYETTAPYRLIKMTEAFGTSSARVTFFEHKDSDNEPDVITENYGDPNSDGTKAPYETSGGIVYNVITRIFRDTRGRVMAVVNNYNTADLAGTGSPVDQGIVSGNDDLLEVSSHADASDFNLITKFTYDDANQVTEIIDNAAAGKSNYDAQLYNRSTRYFYDKAGRVLAVIFNYNAANFSSAPTQTIYFGAGGTAPSVALEISPDFPQYNRIIWNKYDSSGRLSEQVMNHHPLASTSEKTTYNLVTLYKYNSENHVVYTIRNYATITDQGASNAFNVTVDGTSVVVDPDQPDFNIITCIKRDENNRPEYVREACIPPTSGNFVDYQQVAGSVYNLVTRFFYDINGQPVAQIRMYDETNAVQLSNDRLRLVLTDQRNLITRVYYDALGRVKFIEENFASTSTSTELLNEWPIDFDETMPDRNLTTKYDYNKQTQLIAVIMNYADIYPSPTPDGIITADDIDQGLPKHLNLVMWRDHDDFGRPAEFITNFRGSIDCTSSCPTYGGTPDRNLPTTYTYDPLHRPLTATDVRGTGAANNRVTEVTYDPLDRILTLVDNKVASGGTAPTNVTTSFKYSLLDLQEEVTDAANRLQKMEYDNAGRITTHRADPNVLNLATTYTYDAADQVTQVNNPAGESTNATYDAVGRVIKTSQDPDLVSGTNPLLVVQTRYDAMSRVQEITHEDGTVTRYEYTNTGWISTVFENYVAGRNDSTHPACGSDLDGINVCTHFDYNFNGSLIQTTLPNNTVSRYQYDALGQLRFEWIDPGQDGTPTGADYQNLVTEYCYTPMGAVKTVVRGSITSYTVSWSPAPTLSGSLCSTPNDASLNAEYARTTFTHDGLGRITVITFRDPITGSSFEAANDVTSITYDAWGNRDTMSDGLGSAWDFDFDGLNRPLDITDPWGSVVNYTHNNVGDRTHVDVTGDSYTSINYEYDGAGRLTDLTNPFIASPTTKVHYTYDTASRVLTTCNVWQSSACQGFTTTYTYDDASRLELLQNGTISTFDYQLDLRGNRTAALETLNNPTGGMLNNFQFGSIDDNIQQPGRRFGKAINIPDFAPVAVPSQSQTDSISGAVPAVPSSNPPDMPAPAESITLPPSSDSGEVAQPAACPGVLNLSEAFAAAMGHEEADPFAEASLDTLEAEESTYQASFNAEGVRFVGMEANAPLSSDVQFALNMISQQGVAVDAPALTPNVADKAWLTCGNLAFRPAGEGTFEIVSMQADGIQLGYLLNDNPLNKKVPGDLEFEIALNTELELTESSNGLLLLDEIGNGVRISDAVAIDSAGQQVTLEMRVDAGKLILSVPRDWLAGASFPILVDPTFIRWTHTGTFEWWPQIAYDKTSDKALVVYEDAAAGNIYGRFIDTTTGNFAYGTHQDFLISNGHSPAVTVNVRDTGDPNDKTEYLVAYAEGNNLTVTRIVDSGTTLVLNTEIVVVTNTRTNVNRLSLAMKNKSRALLVWHDKGSDNDYDIRGVLLNSNGTVVTGGDFYIEGAATGETVEAKYPYVTFYTSQDQFLVTYRTNSGSDTTYVRSVSRTTVGSMGTAVSVGAGTDPTVAYNSSAGTAGESLVVRRSGNNLYGYRVSMNTSGVVSLVGSEISLKGMVGTNKDPNVAADPTGGWIVTWHNDSSTLNDVWALGVPLNASGALTDEPILVAGHPTNEEKHAIVMVRTNGTALIVLEEWSNGNTQSTINLIVNAGSFSSEPVETNGTFNWHYEYDKLGRLTAACTKWTTESGGTPYCEGNWFEYTYNAAGGVLRFDRWNSTTNAVEAVRNTYNSANQLTESCIDTTMDGGCSGSEQVIRYQYDVYGNLVATCLSANWDGTNKKCTSGTEIIKYTYDAAMRLKKVVEAGTTYTYTYNGDGERVRQKVDAGGSTYTLTTYVLDLASAPTMVLKETTETWTKGTPDTLSSTAPSIRYLYGYELVAQYDGTNVRYFANDGLGSVRQIISISGGSSTILRAQTFDPFGNLYRISTGTATSNFGFTGQMTDGNGLSYLRSRYYDPSIGQFTQTDPFMGSPVLPQSLHHYAYVHNNPVRYTDPNGECIIICGILGGLAIAAITAFTYDVMVTQGAGGYGPYENPDRTPLSEVDYGQAAQTAVEMAPVGACIGGGLAPCAASVGLGAAGSNAVAQAKVGLAEAGVFGEERQQWAEEQGQAHIFEQTVQGAHYGPLMLPAIFGGPVVQTVTGGLGALGSLQYTGQALDQYQQTGDSSYLFDAGVGLAGFAGSVKMAAHGLSQMSCMNSFSADTPVATEDGEKPISEVEEGDEVLAYNEKTGEVDEYTVTDAFWHVDTIIIELTIDGETIYTTPEHPFYTDEGEWKNAEDIYAGEKIRSSDGSYGTVTSTHVVRDANQPMYNLTVDEAHTFFVGEGEWLVHNRCQQPTIVYEAELERGVDYPLQGVSERTARRMHNRAANRHLYEALQSDPVFAQQMQTAYPSVVSHVQPGPRGGFSASSPPGYNWHHAGEPSTYLFPNNYFPQGRLQLISTAEHESFRAFLHPDVGNRGGLYQWGMIP